MNIMKCYSFSIEIETKGRVQISDKEVAMIKKKEHYYGTLIVLILGVVIMSVGIVISLFDGVENVSILCILMLFFVPMLICQIKEKVTAACYAVVTDKEIRHAKIYCRSTPKLMPYEKTECGEVKGHGLHLLHQECNYYYCSVKINEQEYTEICCYKDDFEKIEIGDKAIVAVLNNSSEPILYSVK